MNTVTYVRRFAGNEPEKTVCSYEDAEQLLKEDEAECQSYGETIAKGEGWFTATNPKTGDSVTYTILK